MSDDFELSSKRTPRVDSCIRDVMRLFPGESKAAQARYFEELAQYLGPLARDLEIEVRTAKAGQAAAWEQLVAFKRQPRNCTDTNTQALAVAIRALEWIRDSRNNEQGRSAGLALKEIAALTGPKAE